MNIDPNPYDSPNAPGAAEASPASVSSRSGIGGMLIAVVLVAIAMWIVPITSIPGMYVFWVPVAICLSTAVRFVLIGRQGWKDIAFGIASFFAVAGALTGIVYACCMAMYAIAFRGGH